MHLIVTGLLLSAKLENTFGAAEWEQEGGKTNLHQQMKEAPSTPDRPNCKK